MGISTTAGVLFFGAEGTKPVAWDAIPELVINDDDFVEEQSKIFATMRDSQTVTMGCHISKSGIKNLMGIFREFKAGRGPERKHMIKRVKKMQTNYIYEYEFIKEGDKYVDKRGQIRLVLQ